MGSAACCRDRTIALVVAVCRHSRYRLQYQDAGGLPGRACLWIALSTCGPRSIWKRIGHLAVAGVLLLAISLSWALAVDLTPASLRPYVGSSQDNSEISLSLGYNGISR